MAAVTMAMITMINANAMVHEPRTCSSVPLSGRVDCTGGAKISADLCVGRGCCFDSKSQGNTTTCFYPDAAKLIKTVHVISSNHFDAGYADMTAGVVNMYFDKYFPRAAQVGADLKKTTGQSLKWMTFSFLVSLYVDCPPAMGLHCPGTASLAQFSQAVKDRHIVWPALPTNAELAAADAASLRFGVQLSNATSDRFQIPRPRVLSTRDVPGMPRSAIPILKEAGVLGLSEGMNGRMVPLNVPPIFRWTDSNSGASILTLWHWHGYGSLTDPGAFAQLPGSEHAIAYNWRGDNAGPAMSAQEMIKDFATVQANFPGASVVSSTLTEFVEAVLSEGADQYAPEVKSELADTWVWGMASDPLKLMKMRAINSARTACEAAGITACSFNNPQYHNLSRLTQKNIEHTWGVSVFHYGKEANADWGNAKFHAGLAANNSVYNLMESSWNEQRLWGIEYPVKQLATEGTEHPLLPLIEAEFLAMKPTLVDPAAMGFVRSEVGSLISLPLGGAYSGLVIDNNGAITSLECANGGGSVASPDQKLGALYYQTLVLDDFLTFQSEYLIPGSGGGNEFGKPASFMMAEPTPKRRLEMPVLANLWSKANTVLADVRFSAEAHIDAGAPEWARINYTATHDGLSIELTLVNKTSTRMPEALYFGFNPRGSGTGIWSMDKLGSAVSPLDVIDGGSKGLHCVSAAGVSLNANGTLRSFGSPDAALVRWDKMLPFPTPLHRQPNLSLGMSWNLYNNIWNTNYPFWYPFAEGDETIKFRFTITEG